MAHGTETETEKPRGIPPEKLAELREKHPRNRYVEGPTGEPAEWAALLVPPSGPVLKQYKHELHDPTMRADAQERLVRKMIGACWTLWSGECPPEKLLEEYPLAPEGCGDAMGALTGLSAQARGKA
jgi:hypothetical protein